MYRVEQSRGAGKTPGPWDKEYTNLYFIFSMMFNAFIISNMFVGVLCSAYNRQKDKLGKLDTISAS